MSANLPDHTRRMSAMVNRPGGITLSQAVSAAEANLETLRERGLDEITTALTRVYALGEALKTNPSAADQAELYKLGNFLVGVSGVFGFAGLGEISFSLCCLLDRLRMAGSWSMPSVQIHLDSLRLAYSGTVQDAEMAAIRQALRRVVDRVQA